MKKLFIRGIIRTASLALLIYISSCEKKSAHETGFLEGVISIGPICPVEKNPPDPGCLPTAETYQAYPVGIWSANGSRKTEQIAPALDGSYRAELAPGNYRVILEKEQYGIGGSNLPVDISIFAGNTTLLNISIDTGIR